MTYCVGIALQNGLVMLADTRTNAGVDDIATFQKMSVWEAPGDRMIALCTSGNLAVSQAVVDLLGEGDDLGPLGAVLHQVEHRQAEHHDE